MVNSTFLLMEMGKMPKKANPAPRNDRKCGKLDTLSPCFTTGFQLRQGPRLVPPCQHVGCLPNNLKTLVNLPDSALVPPAAWSPSHYVRRFLHSAMVQLRVSPKCTGVSTLRGIEMPNPGNPKNGRQYCSFLLVSKV